MPTKKVVKTKEEETEKEEPVKIVKKEEKSLVISFKGKYIKTIGRRKTAIAEVRVYPEGSGKVAINHKTAEKYFGEDKASIALTPIKLTGHSDDLDISILAHGGGTNAQAEAVRHGLARALLLIDPELKGTLKAKGWLTRDSRKVERKKPGLKKARKAPQWSKR